MLLTLQFTISVIAIVSSIALVDNAQFQRDFDLGVNLNGVAYSWVRNQAEYEQFRNRLLQHPDISSIASSTHHIGTSYINDPVKIEGSEIDVDILDAGDDYLKTVGLTLLEGRDFIKDSESDKRESVIVTQAMADRLGWTEPLGKEVVWMDSVKYVVVGVVKTVLNQGLWRKAEPMMIRYNNADVRFIIVSAPEDKIKGVKESMEAIHKELFPERIARIRLMDEVTVNANAVNNNILTMFIFTGVVALFLSAAGLFTLVSLSIIKKLKEIGVRKVFGASASNLLRVINGEFFAVLTIAVVLGAASGSWMTRMFMGSIWAYYQSPTLWTILGSVIVIVAVAVATVGYKILQTVRLNPSTVLRDE